MSTSRVIAARARGDTHKKPISDRRCFPGWAEGKNEIRSPTILADQRDQFKLQPTCIAMTSTQPRIPQFHTQPWVQNRRVPPEGVLLPSHPEAARPHRRCCGSWRFREESVRSALTY